MGSLENMETGEVFALSPSTRVGRGAANELSLDDREVSTLHAFIEWRGGFWRLRDLGSTNGTMVDDRRADGGPLSTGQVVQFGSPAQRWQVISVRPPRARALPVGGGAPVVGSAGGLTFPPAARPAARVRFDGATRRWQIAKGRTWRDTEDGAIVEVGGRRWRLELPEGDASTSQRRPPLSSLSLRIEPLGAERCRAWLIGEDRYDLGANVHHRLTWALAGARLAAPGPGGGWVGLPELAARLGLSDRRVVRTWAARARGSVSRAVGYERGEEDGLFETAPPPAPPAWRVGVAPERISIG